ncbi:MAG TPA: phosphoribosyltransferase family protein [Candidatus Paceibacterota bacterium]|nr:phosphoribosyltransferase family protein [Candidatus Paceibacterota bacterium]
MKFLNTILDIVFPAKCVSCGQSGADLCIKCLSDFPTAERETAKWIFPLFDYRHPPLKRALWLFKYKNKKSLARFFAKIIYDKILEELSELSLMENFNHAVLIPIPLSNLRYRERGYNQAELICKELIRINKLRHGADLILENNILIKPKETKHQAHIENKTKRLKNITGSFSVKNCETLKGRNIILIDDIITTGATLTEAKKILKLSGARKVIAFTVAH